MRNTVLRTQGGSGLPGVTVDSTDDRDEMGVTVLLLFVPPQQIIEIDWSGTELPENPAHARAATHLAARYPSRQGRQT